MIIDTKNINQNFFNTVFDVCISGSGPAGMSLALKLARNKVRVLLLEAGGLEYSEESTKVYEGGNIGLDYFPPSISRQRFFGGTSNHWGGWCRELSAIDFESRSHVPLSGWPIKLDDLTPFSSEAKSILDVATPYTPDYILQDATNSDLMKIPFDFSDPPTRFGPKYKQEIEQSEHLTCLINANLIDIVLDDSHQNVEAFSIADYDKNLYRAKARTYALCHGGIENPRTLLNSNKQLPQGVGNANDMVGRCFMEHPHFVVGEGILNFDDPGIHKILTEKPDDLRVAFYEATREFQQRLKTLNFAIRFEPRRPMLNPNREVPFKEKIKEFICESDALFSISKKLTSASAISCPYDFSIRTAAEQCPNKSSRIVLNNELDQFGNRRIDVNWELNELDLHTLRQSAFIAGEIIAEKDLGRVRISEWLLDDSGVRYPTTSEDEVGGFHHMGTTRMALTPQEGVVDKDLRVFGTNNLYIGGSSVFPTSGHANPTYTIVQLSLRLAQHLQERLAS